MVFGKDFCASLVRAIHRIHRSVHKYTDSGHKTVKDCRPE